MRSFNIIFASFSLFALLVSASQTILGCTNTTATTGNATVLSTVLIFARDSTSAYSATSGLNAYGIPYELVIVPQAGVTLPVLNSSSTAGRYGSILILSEVSYGYANGWYSALTTDQWNQLYAYQISFGVRMVRLDVFPSSDFGVNTMASDGSGCCGTGVEQLISFSNTAKFPTAGINTGAGVTTQGLWHYPAKMIDYSFTTEIAQFAPSTDGTFATNSTAAVINSINGRQQMVFFISWATEWSQTSNFLQHAYITWMTRGLFVGQRRVYLNTQVDDVHLKTAIYLGSGTTFRVRPEDMQAHVTWQANMNTRLAAGSNYTIELGHNGDYDIENALLVTNWDATCNPDYAIYPTYYPDPPLEFQKPLGTGIDCWPTTPTNYSWSVACALADPLASWFSNPTNSDHFSHVSHTFTHENLNNATYNDTSKEISWNVAWLKQIGLYNATRFSPKGLIPPAITGLHNGDAIKAWIDQGITYAVGDNSRPPLRNTQNEYWPLITMVSTNGYDGLTVIPRWPTPIYYNCDTANCTTQEWIDTSGGSGNFSTLLDYSRQTATGYLLGLHPDPYMFHQANLRQIDMPMTTIGSQTGQLSLLMSWVETVMQEFTRLVNWPVLSIKHDDIGVLFTNRMTRDNCGYNLAYSFSADGSSITEVTLTSHGNVCGAPIPITFPVDVTTNSPGVWFEKIGKDPEVAWVTMQGSAVSFTLSTPISVVG